MIYLKLNKKRGSVRYVIYLIGSLLFYFNIMGVIIILPEKSAYKDYTDFSGKIMSNQTNATFLLQLHYYRTNIRKETL